ncbi:hypothetical protein HKX48_009359 [Thoreauomyces humboldtii]|nr:hypothetical protein HKX48_009359 [Thoreauomyces humboldtii]
MVHLSIHPLAPSASLVTGFNNVGSWAIEGVVRLSASNTASQADLATPSSSTHADPAFTAASIKVGLIVSAGTSVASRSESDLMAALGSSGSRDAKWNGIIHLQKELELVPQTSNAANGVIVRDDSVVDLPFRFEFGTGMSPTCEVERGRYFAFSRYRLKIEVQGRPHGLKKVFDPRNLTLDYDVQVPFFDSEQVKQLLEPTPQGWTGDTEELAWAITLGSPLLSPSEFSKVFIKANLHERTDPAGRNSTASLPTTALQAQRSKENLRAHPAPYISRATFTLVEDANVQAYTIASTPAAALSGSRRGGFDLFPRRKSRSDHTLVDRDSGGGQREIMSLSVDGEHLGVGHELSIQLPPVAPALPTPGSKEEGRAVLDRKMSTGDAVGSVATDVQINPSGNWGSFQITHTARVTIECADGHTVLWETPITISSCTASQARALNATYPTYTSLAREEVAGVVRETAGKEEADRQALRKAGEMVEGVVRRDVPCVRVDEATAVAAS